MDKSNHSERQSVGPEIHYERQHEPPKTARTGHRRASSQPSVKSGQRSGQQRSKQSSPGNRKMLTYQDYSKKHEPQRVLSKTASQKALAALTKKKTKMVPISKQDFSSRLQQMQNRLEQTKQHYRSTSSSRTPNETRPRSRSQSPHCSLRKMKPQQVES